MICAQIFGAIIEHHKESENWEACLERSQNPSE